MKTIRLLADNPADIAKAGKILQQGGLVGIPTETVYGLAADALNGEAVAKIFKAKGRPMDNPLIVHISDIGQWKKLVRYIPENAQNLAKAFGRPADYHSPKSDCIPLEVSAGLETVAVRFPGTSGSTGCD